MGNDKESNGVNEVDDDESKWTYKDWYERNRKNLFLMKIKFYLNLLVLIKVLPIHQLLFFYFVLLY